MVAKSVLKSTREATADRKKRRTLTEVLSHIMNGNELDLPKSLPIVRLAERIRDGLLDAEIPIHSQHQLLGLVWERAEGKVPDKLEVDVAIRGVIALPLLRASEMDWGAEAVQILAADASARKALRDANAQDADELPATPDPLPTA